GASFDSRAPRVAQDEVRLGAARRLRMRFLFSIASRTPSSWATPSTDVRVIHLRGLGAAARLQDRHRGPDACAAGALFLLWSGADHGVAGDDPADDRIRRHA